ncbi:sensor c-di-GMP phosphodiesterase, contains CSS-motif sensor and EAL domain [Pseudoxanthomonas sp. GM95]|uniref:EAL domain-containing protein n=1 Tax=Pseudoxanthomonas sp. GM95 TaxID=1881043 RepID=UPI0008D00128|nr:EAL domain-containing protein [Pseudoxanthomonas sp. GM95]SEL51581.1 sensor c-di-GMP phosphodiesterase, contains CSS-motif sensor and EAL domain [Pseudoxanthomonas sp. GM95]
MPLRRRKILWVGVGLACVAAMAPIAGAFWFAQQRAQRNENRHLAEYAQWVLLRAGDTLDSGAQVLRQLDKEGWDRCSPAHVARMRELTVSNTAVDEVGYFQKGRLACTSWGKVDVDVEQKPAPYALGDGLGLDVTLAPRLNPSGPMVVLSYGPYNALIPPARLVDVLSDTRMAFGIAMPDGRLIAQSDHLDPALLDTLLRQDMAGVVGEQTYASQHGPFFRAVAVGRTEDLQERRTQELFRWMPIGVLVSLLLAGLIVLATRWQLSPARELSAAIRGKKLAVFYQPIISLESGRCTGAEALLRWPKSRPDLASPDVFIALAEQAGLMERLTQLVVDRVAADLPRILALDGAMHVAINVSADDLRSGSVVTQLARATKRHDLKPANFWIEATERGFIDVRAATATLAQLRAQGYKIAIDDFGTGYSSLSLLQSLPLDCLKIDKSFVDAIGLQTATSVVTPHIIEIARSLELEIVAEGVETELQAEFLSLAGVAYAQGWRYAKALPLEEFIAFVQQHAARLRSEGDAVIELEYD